MKNQTTNKISFGSALLATALILVLAVPAVAQGRFSGNGNGPGAGLLAPAQTLTEDEAKWATFMREEEKLARDVYQLM